jgi:prolyl oligopeptidase
MLRAYRGVLHTMRRVVYWMGFPYLFFLMAASTIAAFTVLADSANSSESTQVASNGLRGRAMGTDAFSYLEDTNSERARAWVQAQNERTLRELQGDSRYPRYFQAALESEHTDGGFDDAGLITKPGWMSLQDGYIYQVWDDDRHSRGVWRRASLASFLTKKPQWQELLDIDALCAAEKQDWTFASASVSPNGRRALVQLSRGGSISSVWREFDFRTRAFVYDGFSSPLSTDSNAAWRTDDVVLVGANFGPGSVNAAGTSLVIKKWRRGQSLAQAEEVFRGVPEDGGVHVGVFDAMYGSVSDEDGNRVLHVVHEDARQRWTWWRVGRNDDLERLTLPPKPGVVFYKGHYITLLLSDWSIGGKTWKQGSVISISRSEASKEVPRVEVMMQPPLEASVDFIVATTPSGVLLFGSHLGNGRVWRARLQGASWTVDQVPLPEHGSIIQGAADIKSDSVFVRYESFLQPPALYAIDVKDNRAMLFATSPPQFDATSFVTEQWEAKSADGTLVPYFVVRPRTLRFDGRSPVLALGYGAGGGSQTPQYSGALGRLWLQQGGIYAVANIRGGSERGAEWHVVSTERRRTYEDMIAVTEDLIRRNVTAPRKVGFIGYSAGGILGGVMLNERPDLFGAAVLKAPVLDELRRDLMMGMPDGWNPEFGSLQDPKVKDFLERHSPFQNLRADAAMPRPLLITSSTDETVPPAQARRYAAKLDSLKKPFLFYETREGGHGLAATTEGRAQLQALVYTYLARQLSSADGTQPAVAPR